MPPRRRTLASDFFWLNLVNSRFYLRFYHVHGSPQTVEHRVTVLPFAKYITVSILVDINRGYPQTVEHRVTVLPFAKYIYTHSSSHVFGQ